MNTTAKKFLMISRMVKIQAVINLFNQYSLIASEAKHKTKYRERLKISSPKQMFQRRQ